MRGGNCSCKVHRVCCSINKTDGHSVLALCDLSSAAKLAERLLSSQPRTFHEFPPPDTLDLHISKD